MVGELFSGLKDFVMKQSGVEDEEITRNTQIEDDLGVTVDNAVDFIIAYGKAFNVNVTGFMAADYFGAERNVILSELFRWITGNQKRTRKILTVGHLEKGIIAGKLNDEVVNS
jgi:hypothetical protein